MIHTGTVLIGGPKVCAPLSACMMPLGAQNITVNSPAVFIHHDPEADLVYWLFESIVTGDPIPPDSRYCGTVCLLEKQSSMIAVPGSRGMTNQDEVKINVVHIYCRLCPPDELPEQFKDKEPGN